MTLLKLQSVSKSYGAVAAVQGVSLSIEHGSRTAIVGASGSGKTTLLRLIGGFEIPDTGYIEIEGKPIIDGRICVPAHLRGVGYVTQDGSLFPHLTVAQNVAFGMTGDIAARQRRTIELLEMVGLDAAAGSRRPDQISGGQQQRIALARALAQQPRLMLLDEPFSALDSGLRAATRRAVIEVLAAHSVSSILVTHDHEEALSFAHQIAVLVNGRLAQHGTPHDVYWRPLTREVACLLGDALIMPAAIANGFAETIFGPVPVEASVSHGVIMLRPEQLTISEQRRGDGLPSVEARVVAVEFAGGGSRLSLRTMPGSSATNAPPMSATGDDIVLWHRKPSMPAVGDLVQLSVTGPAHLLPDAAHAPAQS